MNVLYCGDAYIERGVLLSVLSLLEHTPDEPLCVWIVTARVGDRPPVSSRFAEGLDELLREDRAGAGASGSVTLLDATDAFEAEPPAANMDTRFTPCCMLRLYADRLEGLPERILYLDNDVVCMGDPRPLYAFDLDGAEFAGALDYYGRFFFRRSIWHMDYMNSGVLLMDLARMRETGLLAACRDRCASKRMFMPDQTSLNKLAREKRILPQRMNDQRRLHADTVMRHYSNCFGIFPPRLIDVKPWQIERVHDELHTRELDGLYARYERAAARIGPAGYDPDGARVAAASPDPTDSTVPVLVKEPS